jgi:hypothetical protein
MISSGIKCPGEKISMTGFLRRGPEYGYESTPAGAA